MIRCDICGNPIELDQDDTLTEMDVPDDVEGFTQEEVKEAILDALESGPVEDYSAAQSLKKNGYIKGHNPCIEKLSIFPEDEKL